MAEFEHSPREIREEGGKLTLVSHHLCPYVQRAAIALYEKGVPFERVYIDLANKPEWFNAISPLGKVPLLKIEWPHRPDTIIFESSVIVEYLEDVYEPRLHPQDAVERALNRAWMEFGSATLNQIGRLYSAPEEAALLAAQQDLQGMLARVEGAFGEGPWFGDKAFCLVDAVFAPILRYFEVIDQLEAGPDWQALPRLAEWRQRLLSRPSVAAAVSPGYGEMLRSFIEARQSALGARAGEARLASAG